MTKIQTRLLLIALAVTVPSVSDAATIISQSANGASASSGAGNYGQAIYLDSSLIFENSLSSLSLTMGGSGGGTATGYIDVYTIGSANFSNLNFGTGAETGNLNYLGSSTNALDTSGAASGDSLVWNFSSITLPYNETIFLVFSDTATDGSYVGTSMRVEGSPVSGDYTNITAANSHTLAFGGNVSTAAADPVDNQYSVTLVPEPSSMLLGAFGTLLLLRRRR